MTNLIETPVYEAGIFQLETTTPVIGGQPAIVSGSPVAGHSNAQALQLANRTAYLKNSLFTQVANRTALQNLEIPVLSPGRTISVYVASYADVGDGGEGYWYWQSNSNEVASDMVIIPASNPPTGRWKRSYYGSLRPEFFGAKGDFDWDTQVGTVDTAALQRMFNWASKDGTEIRPMAGKKYLTDTLRLYYDVTLNPGWSGNAGRTKIVGQANGHATGALEDPGCAFVHVNGSAGYLLDVKGVFDILLPVGMAGYFSLEDFNLVGGSATTDVLNIQGAAGRIFLKNYGIRVKNPAGNGLTMPTAWAAVTENGQIWGLANGDGSWTGTGFKNKSDGTGGQINMQTHTQMEVYKMGYGITVGRGATTVGTFGPVTFIEGQTAWSDQVGMTLGGGIQGLNTYGMQHEQSRLNGLLIDSQGANDIPRQIKIVGGYFTHCGKIQDGSNNEFAIHVVDGESVEIDGVSLQNSRSGIIFDRSKARNLKIRRPQSRTVLAYGLSSGRGIDAYGTLTVGMGISLEEPVWTNGFSVNVTPNAQECFDRFAAGDQVSFSSNLATPNISLGGINLNKAAGRALFNNSSTTIVTNILGGQQYQQLICTFSNTNTTIQSNGNIFLQDGKSFTPKTSKAVLVLEFDGTAWKEISRSYGNETKSTIVATSAVALPHPGTITTEYTFVSVDIPAGMLGLNGILEVDAVFSYSNNANTKTMRFRHGGGAFFSTTATATSSASFLKKIQNRGVANSQVGEAASGQQTGTNANAPFTATVDTAVTTAVIITGQLAVGTDTMTLERYTVKVVA